MEYRFNTPLNGNIAMTYHYHEDAALRRDKSLYKFVWVQSGTLDIEVDHVVMHLEKDEIISLTPLHHVEVKRVEGEYLTFLFNSNFYCIYGHDKEVSCNGFLFHGSSHIMRLQLSAAQSEQLKSIIDIFAGEFGIKDNLQEEMLRIILKRFIITYTRIAREKLDVGQDKEKSFDIIRRYYVLVDNHYKEKKQVQDYAEMLYRSPKTLSNLFAAYGLPSPLRIIHERIEAEAKRLLLYTNKSAKEIGEILGFEDLAAFSRFFRKMAKESINLIRVAILVIFVWIGGLKFWNYEAEGIVPFVANSPFMSFFYTKSAPEYKEYKLKEGEFDEAKHQWHEENNTYGFSHGLGILIMTIGVLTFLGIFSPKIGLVGAGLAIIMTLGTLSFLVTTPEVWVPDLGSGEHGFPLLTGAGRLVIKDVAILAGALVVLSDSARSILKQQNKG